MFQSSGNENKCFFTSVLLFFYFFQLLNSPVYYKKQVSKFSIKKKTALDVKTTAGDACEISNIEEFLGLIYPTILQTFGIAVFK